MTKPRKAAKDKGDASTKGKGGKEKGKGAGDTKGNGKADTKAPPATPPAQRKLECWTCGEEHYRSQCPKLVDEKTVHPKAKAKTKADKAKLKQAQTEKNSGGNAPTLQVMQAAMETAVGSIF